MIWESNECSIDRAHTVSLQPLFYAFSVEYVTIIAGQCTHIFTITSNSHKQFLIAQVFELSFVSSLRKNYNCTCALHVNWSLAHKIELHTLHFCSPSNTFSNQETRGAVDGGHCGPKVSGLLQLTI